MPNHTYKSAAVPFVNQKGERSMKRVKVERYVAGKKPKYAENLDDEEDEYYTTDDEDGQDDWDSNEEEEPDEQKARTSRVDIYDNQDEDDEDDDQDEHKPIDDKSHISSRVAMQSSSNNIEPDVDEDEDDEEDDPRFRRLKQIDKKQSVNYQLENIHATTTKLINRIEIDETKVILDDEDDEEEIRERHLMALSRPVEQPIGPQAILSDTQGDPSDQLSSIRTDDDCHRSLKEETEDILKDLKLEGFKPKNKSKNEEAKLSDNLKEFMEQAKQKATMETQLHKKIEEDIKRELAQEALKKNDFGAYDMSSVNTDDEDDDIAYNEWKLREIKRVLRDKSERMLEAK